MIRLAHITKSYTLGGHAVHVLRDVSLTIARGDFLAIMGPSGSGKSTLMNIIGLLDAPTSGSYRFEEREVARIDEDEQAEIRSRRIGFVFQAFNLLPRIDALRQVMQPLLYQGVARASADARARAALHAVGLEDRIAHKPNELSGGQQQRVSIARALVADPALILADEPTGALDTTTGEEVMDILTRLNALGKTILVVTHEPNVAAHARRTIHIQDGSVASRHS